MSSAITMACVLAFIISQVPTDGLPVDQIIQNDLNLDDDLALLEGNNDLNTVEHTTSRIKRKARRRTKYRWPNNTVYYEMNKNYSQANVRVINEAMREWEHVTCLKFVEDSTRPDKIKFIGTASTCYSFIGRTGGDQRLNLHAGCFQKRTVLHELGHAIGFYHEHQRPDRDDYIKINFEKIPSERHHDYRKRSSLVVNTYGVEYDYDSIMHYSSSSFGRFTIVTTDPSVQDTIGRSRRLSFRDIKLANSMYNCARDGGMNCPPVTCPGEGFQGKDCLCYCPGDPISLCTHNNTGKCPKGRNAYSSHPTNPKFFYQCSHGRFVLHVCPSGTVWNNRITSCDHEIPTTSGCPLAFSFLPHPSDCRKYIQCAHYHPYVMECPKYTKWNQAFTGCELGDC